MKKTLTIGFAVLALGIGAAAVVAASTSTTDSAALTISEEIGRAHV